MTQPPYGPGSDPYQNPQTEAGGVPSTGGPGTPPQGGNSPPAQGGYSPPAQGGYGPAAQGGYGPAAQGGYGPPAQGGYGSPPSGYPAAAPGYGAAQPGYPGGPSPYGGPQAPKSKTGLIIAAIVGVLAIAGVILAVVLVNKVPAPAALVQGDDPALNALAQDCFDGDMSACDDLFFQAPVDSDYERYGNTCGGRIDEAEVNSRLCTNIF